MEITKSDIELFRSAIESYDNTPTFSKWATDFLQKEVDRLKEIADALERGESVKLKC